MGFSVGSLSTSVSDLGLSVGSFSTSLSDLGFSVGSLSTSVSDLGFSVGSLSTSVSDLGFSVGSLSTSVSDLGFSVGSLSTSVSNVNTSLTSLYNSVTYLYGQMQTNPEAQSFQIQTVQGALETFNGSSASGILDNFPIVFDVTGASKTKFRPFYMNTSNSHFFTTTNFVRRNGLMVTNDDYDVTLHSFFQTNTQLYDYLLIDAARIPLVSGSSIRVFNDWSPTSITYGTTSVAAVKPAFSLTGCSYSMFPPGTNSWALSACQPMFQAIQSRSDFSTVYVARGYVDVQSLSASFPSASLYWAFVPTNSVTSLSAPEMSSYILNSNSQLDLSLNIRQIQTASASYFVPLLPNEDSWNIILNAKSATQYSLSAGLGNFPSVDGITWGSQTSLSFIGGFEWNTSLSYFSMSANQFFFFYSNSNAVGSSMSDGIYYCVNSHSCTSAASVTADGSFTFNETGFHLLDATALELQYGLIRVFDGAASDQSISSAFDSISALQSISFNLHPFELDPLTMITEAKIGRIISTVQPQENLTLVNKSPSVLYWEKDRYAKIPSILNPSNVTVSTFIYSPILLSETTNGFLLWTSLSGPFQTVTMKLDSVTFYDYTSTDSLHLVFPTKISTLTNPINMGALTFTYNNAGSKSVAVTIPNTTTFPGGSFSFDVVFNTFPDSLWMSYSDAVFIEAGY